MEKKIEDAPRPSGSGPVENLRSEAHIELKNANIVFNNCLSKNFLPAWLKGADLQLSEVCGAELEDMQEKHSTVYGERPSPIADIRMPRAAAMQ